jgi:NAD-dependent dihydropyrimidine dehydrogenase PreA subunit
MPATEEEITAAIEEGVKIEFLTAPISIGIDTLTCVRMTLGTPDASGRRRPEPVAGREYTIPADTIIVAIGQRPDIPARDVILGVDGGVEANPATLATSAAGIFAGGDAVGGPATIIHAIAQGRRASAAIDRFLGGSGDLECFARNKPEAELKDTALRGLRRRECGAAPLPERLGGFALVEECYNLRTAMDEASRCLSCDLRVFEVRVDAALCKDCGYCREVCGLNVFGRSTEFNASGYRSYVAQRAENCIGCFCCSDICPDFAIEIIDTGGLHRTGTCCAATVSKLEFVASDS